MTTTQEKLKTIERELNTILLEQRDSIHGITLALLANTNCLLLGPPGVGKSMAVRQYSKRITGGNYFEYLLGQYSVPEEIFGPWDIRMLEEGVFQRVTAGRLAEAHTAFLDEIFKGNTGVINTLLKALNEREMDDNGKSVPIPLLAIIGASNELPEDGDGLGAALDRFALKFHITPITEAENFKSLLRTKDRLKTTSVSPITIAEILAAREQIELVEVPDQILDLMVEMRDSLERKGITPSPRVWAQTIALIKSQAWFNNRTKVTKGDVAVLKDGLWSDPGQIKDVYKTVLGITIPEEQQGLDAYDRALEIFSTFTDSFEDESKRNGEAVASNLTALGFEYSGKLKNINKELTGIHKRYQVEFKTTDENPTIMGYIQKVTGLIKTIYTKTNLTS